MSADLKTPALDQRQWRLCQQELAAALVARQRGLTAQAAAHLDRVASLLDPTAEPALEDGAPDRRAVARRWERLHRELRRVRPGDRAGWRAVWLPRLGWIAPLALLLLLANTLAARAPAPRPVADLRYAPREHVRTDLNVLSLRFPGGTIPFHRPGVSFGKSVRVSLGAGQDLCKLSIALRNTCVYRLTLLRHGQALRTFLLGPSMLPNGLRTYKLELCQEAGPRAVDTLLIEGVDTRDHYELGPVSLTGVPY